MTQAGMPMVAVTCRTEYLLARHFGSARSAWLCMIAALVALVVLNAAGVDGAVTATVVAVALAGALSLAAVGRLARRGAVLVTVDADTVYLGDEQHGVTGHRLSDLRSVVLGPVAEMTGAGTAAPRDLTISGLRTLTLGFAGPGEEPEMWRIGVVQGDPAAAEVIGRLTAAAHRRPTPQHSTPPRPTPQHSTPPPTTTPRILDAGSDEAAERLWEEATVRHNTILSEYGAYELQPDPMLRYPAVTDITRTPVQDFHRALDEATALRTDSCPDDRARADAYQQAVIALRRAWIACEPQLTTAEGESQWPASTNSPSTE